jgi:predicted DNA-binding protein with PD1-like motif
MKARLLTDADERTWVLVFQTGDSVMEILREFARQQSLDSARMTAIGAFNGATLAYYDIEKQEYDETRVDEQVEVLAFTGDIAEGEDGKPVVHAHVVVGRRDLTTAGGHLMKATVRPTLEVMLTETKGSLRRRFDRPSGLALISP